MRTRAVRRPSPPQKRSATARILRWYKKCGRALPWRSTRNPYRILVSEIMLQQTQVARVLSVYPRFLQRFPGLTALGAAARREVITAWEGMGYNNRAVRLHALAQTVVRSHGGRIPSTPEALLALPGIGRYTMNAVQAFAFGRRVPVVDVNVRRVLSRLFFRMPDARAVIPEADAWDVAASLLPRSDVFSWNQALMDLGSLICRARAPLCDRCPVARICLSRKRMHGWSPAVRRQEPSFAGTPNRIYRGRVVALLRSAGTMSIGRIGRALIPGFGRRHHGWLRALLAALERDGLVKVSGCGSFASRRAGLA